VKVKPKKGKHKTFQFVVFITVNEDEYFLFDLVLQWSARNRMYRNGERKVLMNLNCKRKRDNDSSVKGRKVDKRKYKGNSYSLVF